MCPRRGLPPVSQLAALCPVKLRRPHRIALGLAGPGLSGFRRGRALASFRSGRSLIDGELGSGDKAVFHPRVSQPGER
jgi:hypothetical protein